MEFNMLGKATETIYTPSTEILDVFENRDAKLDYLVQFSLEDFTSLCPVTGQPDFAKIEIQYIPNKKCIETKSLKYYLHSYRNTKSFNESIINKMLSDFVEKCDPKWMRIVGKFHARGGISLTTVAEYPNLNLETLKNL